MKALAPILLRDSQGWLRADRSDASRPASGGRPGQGVPFGTPQGYSRRLLQGRSNRHDAPRHIPVNVAQHERHQLPASPGNASRDPLATQSGSRMGRGGSLRDGGEVWVAEQVAQQELHRCQVLLA